MCVGIGVELGTVVAVGAGVDVFVGATVSTGAFAVLLAIGVQVGGNDVGVRVLIAVDVTVDVAVSIGVTLAVGASVAGALVLPKAASFGGARLAASLLLVDRSWTA